MADRLIYANKLKAHYAWWKGGTREMTMDEAKSDFDTIIDLQPTVEPTKHGRWLAVKVMDDEADFGETDGAECSVCGYTTNSEYWAKTYYHYCPNCGAIMDEVEE